MSKNYFVAILLLLFFALPLISKIAPETIKSSGVVFYDTSVDSIMISNTTNLQRAWLKPVNQHDSLKKYLGNRVVFEVNNLQSDTTFSTILTKPRHGIKSGYAFNYKIPIYTQSDFNNAWTQVIVSCVTFIIAIILWRRFKRHDKQYNIETGGLTDDLGVFFFGAALILWGIIALISLYGGGGNNDSVVTMLSISNDYLFALSFPFFRHGIPFFKQNKQYYILIFTGLFIASLILAALNFSIMSTRAGKYVELYFTTIVFGTLGYLLNESFTKRGTPLTGLVAVVCMMVASYCQVIYFSHGLASITYPWNSILYISSFITMVVLYITLIYSWYTEEREIQIMNENKAERLNEKLRNTPPTDGAMIQKLLRDLLDLGKIRKPVNILQEKFKEDQTFVQNMVGFNQRLSQLKKEKNNGTRSLEDINVEFQKLKKDLDNTVIDFLNNSDQDPSL